MLADIAGLEEATLPGPGRRSRLRAARRRRTERSGEASDDAGGGGDGPAPRTIRPEFGLDDAGAQLRKDRLDHVFVTAVNGVLVGRIVTEELPAT